MSDNVRDFPLRKFVGERWVETERRVTPGHSGRRKVVVQEQLHRVLECGHTQPASLNRRNKSAHCWDCFDEGRL